MNHIQRIRRWLQVGERQTWVEYGLLSVVILAPLFASGYILTLDLVFTPHQAWPNEVTNTYPLQGALWLFYQLFPGDIVEKLLLFLVVLLSGMGMHLLIRWIGETDTRSDAWSIAAYFAGLLYVVNPFIYARFMAGQWMVLLGYAFLPFFVRALLQFITEVSWRRTWVLSAWAFVITTVSLHHIGMIVVLSMVALAAGTIKYKQQRALLWRGAAVATVLWCAVSSFWLIPTLMGKTSIAQSVGGFNQSHFDAFATAGSNVLGAIGNVIRMQGFWAESQQLFVLPQQITPLWGVFVLLLWILVGLGAVFAWRTRRLVAVVGLVSMGAGILFASTPILYWLGEAIPFVSGYREPHKFVNLIVLGYAVFGAFGVKYLRERWSRQRLKTILTMVVMLLPVIITPTMFGGFAGQLRPRMYPQGWREANAIIEQCGGDRKALFLPWHQYANYHFSGRTIANPAAKYFSFPIISSDDPEFKDISPTLPRGETQTISLLLKEAPTQLAHYLVMHDIGYVLLAKEQEYQSYGFLQSNKYSILLENDTMKVYEVRP